MIETVPSGTILHGRYRTDRVLGSGGFGHVYLAFDLMTNQQCAVKEYLVTGASGQEQLKHEARVLSQLHHPNLPAFLDTFMERGRYYVVLSYIEGDDLTDLVRLTRQRNEAIPIAQLLNWTLSICDGVMFMHSQRPPVVHRDIKPDNIRITPNGTAVLVDLGNAKTVAADGARTLFFIRHQGTPGYAPPEQYPGGTGTDARSDVYALGSTLYFALIAAEPPSVSTRNQAIQQGQPDLPTLQDHLASNPPEESREVHEARQFRLGVSKPAKPAPRHSKHIAQLGTLPPEILNALNRITQKSMALRPKDRYQYVADFANDLKNVIAAFPKPATATKLKDPNSTQPDLAEIYDTLQAAKGQPNQPQPANMPQSPIQPNSGNATMVCPRCQNPLAQNAAFCPRCGTPLRQSNNIMSNSAPHASVNIAQTDKNMRASQEQRGQAIGTTAQRASSFPSATQTPQPEYQYQSNPSMQAQAMIMPSQANQASIPMGNGAAHSDTSQNAHQSNTSTKLIIFGVVVLLVVIIIIAFIFLKHS
jgi:serine/threonine protein kinase